MQMIYSNAQQKSFFIGFCDCRSDIFYNSNKTKQTYFWGLQFLPTYLLILSELSCQWFMQRNICAFLICGLDACIIYFSRSFIESKMIPFQFLLSLVENDLFRLALIITSLHSQICSPEVAECPSKLYNQCIGVSRNKVCLSDYPKEEMCTFDGRLLPQELGTNLPSYINQSILTNQQKLFMCHSVDKLKKEFLEIKKKYENQITRVYFGTNFGFLAAFPAMKQDSNSNDKCKQSYDPSERLWYLQASTGPKNIVFVIDLSSSLTQLQLIKGAIIRVIQTLSFNDFVAVILMKNTSSILIYHELNRATLAVKQALAKSISSLVIDTDVTSVNYQLAFQLTKKLFMGVNADHYGASCQFSSNVVIFLAASPPTQGATTSAQLISKIDEWNQIYKLKFFSYAFTTNQDFSILRNLSCKYQGNFYEQANTTNIYSLSVDLRAYQRFLAGVVNIDDAIWTQPYRDHWTGLQVVTATYPFYTYENGYREKLGVVAMDMQLSVLGITEAEARTKLVRCPTKPVAADKCILQKLRERQTEHETCNIPGCNLKEGKQCSYIVRSSIFANKKDHVLQIEDCCIVINNPNQIVAYVMVGVFVLTVLICLVQRFCFRNQQELKGYQPVTNPSFSSRMSEHSAQQLSEGDQNGKGQIIFNKYAGDKSRQHQKEREHQN